MSELLLSPTDFTYLLSGPSNLNLNLSSLNLTPAPLQSKKDEMNSAVSLRDASLQPSKPLLPSANGPAQPKKLIAFEFCETLKPADPAPKGPRAAHPAVQRGSAFPTPLLQEPAPSTPKDWSSNTVSVTPTKCEGVSAAIPRTAQAAHPSTSAAVTSPRLQHRHGVSPPSAARHVAQTAPASTRRVTPPQPVPNHTYHTTSPTSTRATRAGAPPSDRHGLSHSQLRELQSCGIAARLKSLCPVTFCGERGNTFEQLEFVGDAFLLAELSMWLVNSPLFVHATEHLLTVASQRMSCNAHLAYVFDVLDLDALLGASGRDGGEALAVKPKADVVEAAIGELSMRGGEEAVRARAELIGTIATLALSALLLPH